MGTKCHGIEFGEDDCGQRVRSNKGTGVAGDTHLRFSRPEVSFLQGLKPTCYFSQDKSIDLSDLIGNPSVILMRDLKQFCSMQKFSLCTPVLLELSAKNIWIILETLSLPHI